MILKRLLAPVIILLGIFSEGCSNDSHRPVAEPLPLSKVRVVGENRLTSNRDLDIRAILSWDVRKYLYNYLDTYGLDTSGCPLPEGWDSVDTKLKGHGSGHYMSALALAYAGCDDNALKDSLLARMRTMVDCLRECQERTFVYDEALGRYREAMDYAPEAQLREMKGTWDAFDEYKKSYSEYGYGYLNAIPAAHCALVEMYRPYNNKDWVWAPYYVVHKQLAGLIDIASLVDDKAISQKALKIAEDMGLWVWNRLKYRTFLDSSGTPETRRSTPGNRYEMWNMYIAGEVGGMEESLSRLSMMVEDRTSRERLLEAAGFFDSPAFFEPLARGEDSIHGRHANQHIPMVIGALMNYRAGGSRKYYDIALNFWNFVQDRYLYATGGVGDSEMFREPYTQMASMIASKTPEMNETCCAYNLAKLTKDLNCFDPNDARYMDYYERVLYNQIVGSIHPDEYKVTYQYAVGLDASKPWGNRTPQESCCGGTGAENHVKYQEAAYFVSKDTIWVGLYLPSEARWDRRGVTLSQECGWPAERSVIRLKKGSGRFTMKLRVPYWATEGFDIRLNGKSLASEYTPCSYFEIPIRRWTRSDSLEIIMPYVEHIDYAPDPVVILSEAKDLCAAKDLSPERLGVLMRGPLVMAAVGIKSWDEAVLRLGPDGHPTAPQAATDSAGSPGCLTLDGKTFIPDYQADTSVTHYLRIR
ncbi:MAG: glycoside hydrolase family 127 protein [Bacteroidales bacterium]|nr:glycoside hydrolase family 127 protein [Bacteroidales bacterium]